MTPSERRLRGQIAANIGWSRTEDRSARTAPARRAMDLKFEREVDPDGLLTPCERAVRAAFARRAYYQRLTLASVQARNARKRG